MLASKIPSSVTQHEPTGSCDFVEVTRWTAIHSDEIEARRNLLAIKFSLQIDLSQYANVLLVTC